MTTIRVLLSLAASYGLLVHQMNVKTTFLNKELDEEIYMEHPDGFVVKGQESKVCKLLKSLYGLKQAPKQWHNKVNHISRASCIDTTTVEAEWLRELLMDLSVVEKPIPAILMNCDNQTVIAKVTSSKDNGKSSRHVKR
jgi:hypothetical protein